MEYTALQTLRELGSLLESDEAFGVRAHPAAFDTKPAQPIQPAGIRPALAQISQKKACKTVVNYVKSALITGAKDGIRVV